MGVGSFLSSGLTQSDPGFSRRGAGVAPSGKGNGEVYGSRMDAAEAATLSRVELEHVLVRDVVIGDEASAEVIRAELAGRVWQGTNPYAVTTEPDRR